jgi:hypothetical protein
LTLLAGQKSVHGHPDLSREIESAWTGPIPNPIPAATLQARVLTADITNLLFAADRVAFLAPADRSPLQNRPEAALTRPDAHDALAGHRLLPATPSNVCRSLGYVQSRRALTGRDRDARIQ